MKNLLALMKNMKVAIYDGIWRGCTWYVDVNKLTLNEVISHMQKWFDFQEYGVAGEELNND